MKVRSHPQALAQCENFSSLMDWCAARGHGGFGEEIADGTGGTGKTICSYTPRGLRSCNSIEDNKFNFTRFWVLAKGDAATPTTPKTSVVFRLGQARIVGRRSRGVRPAQRTWSSSSRGRGGARPCRASTTSSTSTFGHHADDAGTRCSIIVELRLRPGSYDVRRRSRTATDERGPVNDQASALKRRSSLHSNFSESHQAFALVVLAVRAGVQPRAVATSWTRARSGGRPRLSTSLSPRRGPGHGAYASSSAASLGGRSSRR